MPQHATKTSFKKGHKRSKESIEKQRATMKTQIRDGTRSIPVPIWSEESKKRMVKRNRAAKLIRWPIGTRRQHAVKGLLYYKIKVSDRGKWPYEHRHIMEQYIDRKLLKTEHVHHINGNTLDNRRENLRLLTNSEHASHHVKSIKGFYKNNPKLPDGVWAREYTECVHCNSTKFKHAAKGYCSKCYRNVYRKI